MCPIIFITFLTYLSPTLGLLGTCLIFFFGVPKQTDTGGKTYIITEEVCEKEKTTIKRYKSLGNVGLILIAISFSLQIAIIYFSN